MNQGQGATSDYSGDGGAGSIVTEQVKQGTQAALQQTQQAAGQVTESAKQGAVSYADSQKSTATKTIRSMADALHETGTSLQHKDQAPFARYANSAGDQIEGFAEYLERTPVQDLVKDAEDFARQHTTLFLGGAVALGLAAARFIKASSPGGGASSHSGSSYLASNRYGTRGYESGNQQGQGLVGAGTSYASGAPYGDGGALATPSTVGTASTSGIADEVEMPDATVFNADLETESGDGTAR